MVTIKDVASRSGFSITTVSKALNNYSDISDKTKARILALCDEMGYVPNLSARSLVSKKSYTIGIIFEEVTGIGLQHPLFSKILESFKSRVEQKGYDIMFLSKSIGNEKGSYLEHSKRKQVEAILVLCSDFDSKEMQDLYKSTLPTIVIDFNMANVCNITSNNLQGVRQAVKYFKDLGHTKVGNIHGGLFLEIGRVRHDHFMNALVENNLEINENFIQNGNFFSKEDGYQAIQEIMKHDEQPTALFCASDMLAIGAMQAINEAGKSVPEDYSIIGFDGIDLGQLISPRLTTIKQDTYKMGKAAANIILQMIDDKNHKRTNETVKVDTILITGESTRVLR